MTSRRSDESARHESGAANTRLTGVYEIGGSPIRQNDQPGKLVGIHQEHDASPAALVKLHDVFRFIVRPVESHKLVLQTDCLRDPASRHRLPPEIFDLPRMDPNPFYRFPLS